MTAKCRKQATFLQALIESGKVRLAEAATLGRDAARLYPESLADLAVEKGLLSEDEAFRSLADFYGHPFINLQGTTVDAAALATLPASVAKEVGVFPFLLNDNEVSIAMASVDFEQLDRVRKETGCEPLVHLATPTRIQEALEFYYPALSLSDGEQATQMGACLSASEDSPVIQNLASAILNTAIRARASDIHIEPMENSVRVRIRVDGVLREEIRVPLERLSPLVARFKILSDLDISETRRPQDGRFAYETATRSLDLRISIGPTNHGEKVVIRLLDRSGELNDLRSMAFSIAVGERLKRVVSAPNGILLVTGPTGSGKTSTCYSIVEHLSDVERNIVTIEDPIEYRFEGITQMQVHHEIGLNFSTILRSVLRQDPDVVLVGEIRDLETAAIATQAALTGHLVISTLHTNNAIQAVVRLVEMGVDPFMVAPTVRGVLGQRLARRICRKCCEDVALAPEDLGLFPKGAAELAHLYRGRGARIVRRLDTVEG